MTLYERVKRAGNTPQTTRPSDAEKLCKLREQLQEIVSTDDLAHLISSNPEQARNEIKSACRQVFKRSEWKDIEDPEQARLQERLLDAIFGFGILNDFLADESITEIIANGPQVVFIEREGKLFRSNRAFANTDELRALIDRILGPVGRRVDEASPMVNARLPQGHRVNVVLPPIALDGPYVTIRKFRSHIITLDEMESTGSIDKALKTFLIWAVRSRRSIAVSGGTGSGKTTLLNALSCAIPHDERIVTIEDSAELRFSEHPDVVRLEARPCNSEGKGEVTIRQLVINALRMRPDRIIVGECRGAEAIDMLQAMNTGHDGSLTTLHANSPTESIVRLSTMVRYATELPVDVIEANIASAIHLTIQTQRMLDGSRRVSEMVSFSFNRSAGCCETRAIYKREPTSDTGRWLSIPEWVDTLPDRGVASKEEVRAWKRMCSKA